ncbi:MAG: DUF480 domain-containing protein [Salinisphaera sp.]|jgi:uncharacterized protein YceH (UPF0502 family)|nr:DUF480 domain-containing protein [Salinisphaera sp.]
MLPQLTDIEARIIGCLMEKSITTPDQYPLTLNALTNACNQKSAREPVLTLKPMDVQRACRALKDRSLLHIEENFKNGVQKYKQRLCNTQFNDLKFTRAGFAIVTLLLLRGAQTPGELRARAGRLHEFADNEAVSAAADELIDTEDSADSIIIRLPRTPGRKEAELMHQFCGAIDVDAYVARHGSARSSGSSADLERIRALEARVAELEAENAELKELLADAP